MSRLLLPVLICCLVAVPTVAAESSASSRKQAKKVANAYTKALIAKDVKALCSLITPADRKETVTSAKAQYPEQQITTCEEAGAAFMADPQFAPLVFGDPVELGKRLKKQPAVKVKGKKATVTWTWKTRKDGTSCSSRVVYSLKRFGTAWKFDSESIKSSCEF